MRQYWGYEDFRPGQDAIVSSISHGFDTLGLMPTGGGKSITFQVPALATEGLCIVITPLVALMKDQTSNLVKRGIKAVAIHSGLTSQEINIAYENCVLGGYKFLYISPERISTVKFLERLPQFNINLLVVDEAHCISRWGYDFRPSYLKISELRKQIPDVPVLALTATATPEIAKDIQKNLLFEKENVIKKSFERKNLAYIVRETEDKKGEILKIINAIKGSVIVFTRNRKRTKEYADWLLQNYISSHYYHAGLPNEVKDKRQEDWMKDRVRVMVCTNAFGMGIDKPEVRLVIHVDSPDTIEDYFQEAGRGGRDGKKAYAVLLWDNTDKAKLKRNISATFPEKEVILRIYEALGNYFSIAEGHGQGMSFNFEIGKFCRVYHFSILNVYNSIKLLSRAGYIYYEEQNYMPSRIMIIVNKTELYQFQLRNDNFNELIKLILRSYSGLFSEYINIDEATLARRAKTTEDVIYNYLKQLQKYNIIKYIPKSVTPKITYLEPRNDKKHVRLDAMIYGDRKKSYEQRIESVIDYAECSHVCRSRHLLRYFGQSNVKDCGMCDVCIDKKKRNIANKDCDKIEELITEFLKSAHSLDEIQDYIKMPQKKWINVFNWMADNEKIIPDENPDMWIVR